MCSLRTLLVLPALWSISPSLQAADLASARQGEFVMRQQGCVQCHSFSERQTSRKKDSARKQDLTPTRLAGEIWNHGRKMWDAIDRTGGARPQLTRQEAFDIIAWFAAAGWFERPGDPRQGALTYVRQGCPNCHGSDRGATAPPVSKWTPVTSAIDLFHAMWRHAPLMKAAMDAREMVWPSLSSEEMRDILAWAAPRIVARVEPNLTIGDPQHGQAMLRGRQCVACHRGNRTLEDVPYEHTLTDLAAVLWNHAPMMMSLPPSLNRQEIADLVAYLWVTRYFEEPGSVVRGRQWFETRRCIACHSSFPVDREYDAATMIAAMWIHTPAVLDKARSLGVVWPEFIGRDMADVIAYVNSIRRATVVK